jgi:glutamine amidotransferase
MLLVLVIVIHNYNPKHLDVPSLCTTQRVPSLAARGLPSAVGATLSKMCRLLVFRSRTREDSCLLADLLFRPSHNLITQSHSSRERTVAGSVPPEINGDGVGVAFYPLAGEPSEANHPAVFRAITPAWSNVSLRSIGNTVRSGCVFAHVRAASPGSLITEANTHPFSCGQWTFMHNGGVGGWSARTRRLITQRASDAAVDMIGGSCDSEYCFALFLTELGRIQPLDAPATVDVVQGCLMRAIFALELILYEAGVDPVAHPSLLNFAVTDGRTVVASRHVFGPAKAATLYLATGTRWRPVPGEKEGAFSMENTDRQRRVAIIASERLTYSVSDAGAMAEEEDDSAGGGGGLSSPSLLTHTSTTSPTIADEDAAEWVEVPSKHLVVLGPQLNVLIVPIPSAVSDPIGACQSSAVKGSDTVWQFMPELVKRASEMTHTPSAAAACGCEESWAMADEHGRIVSELPSDGAIAAAGIERAPSTQVSATTESSDLIDVLTPLHKPSNATETILSPPAWASNDLHTAPPTHTGSPMLEPSVLDLEAAFSAHVSEVPVSVGGRCGPIGALAPEILDTCLAEFRSVAPLAAIPI